MIVTDRFVWVHALKTGGCFIKRHIIKAYPNYWKSSMNHDGVGSIPDKFKHLPVFGNVRNPWDWYVSWYQYFSEPDRRNTYFDICHMDFKTVLKDVLFVRNEFQKIHEFDYETMGYLKIGMYTFHHMAIHFYKSSDRLVTFLRQEKLARDLVEKVPFPADYKDKILSSPRINATETRTSRDYRQWYDEESMEWIRERDRYIIERFGYSF